MIYVAILNKVGSWQNGFLFIMTRAHGQSWSASWRLIRGANKPLVWKFAIVNIDMPHAPATFDVPMAARDYVRCAIRQEPYRSDYGH